MRMINDILSNFSLSNVHIVREIQKNSYNEVYLVESNQGKYILRIGKQSSLERSIFEIIILKHLSKNGIPVPVVIPTQTGDNFQISGDDKKIITLFVWIEGEKYTLGDRVVIKNAGAMLARIHVVPGINMISNPKERTIFSELERVISMKQSFISRYEEAERFIKECEDALIFARENSNTEGVILHNDYRPQNIIIDAATGQINGVIDFDWTCFGPAIKDVAHSLIEWSFPDGADGYNLSCIEMFLEGYNSFSAQKFTWEDSKLRKWMYFSALSDAATYFADKLLESTEEKLVLKSYMYKKAKAVLEL